MSVIRGYFESRSRSWKSRRVFGSYLSGADLSSRNAHLLAMPQLNREDDLVVAGSYRSYQILILPVLFEQLLHVAWQHIIDIGVYSKVITTSRKESTKTTFSTERRHLNDGNAKHKHELSLIGPDWLALYPSHKGGRLPFLMSCQWDLALPMDN